MRGKINGDLPFTRQHEIDLCIANMETKGSAEDIVVTTLRSACNDAGIPENDFDLLRLYNQDNRPTNACSR